MGTEVVDLENFFIGKPDRCERLISCLQYCLESDSANIRNGDHLYAVLEKGLFYRGMIQDFENLEFLSQIDTILNKFSEFEMLFVPKTQIDMCRVKSEIPGTCSAIINIVAQKCPVHKNLSCYILIDTKVNIYVVTVYEKQVVALLSISEDIQMHSVSSTGDVHQILSRDVSSFQPLADSSREEECIAAAHVAVVMCADDETIATMDSDARKLEATLQRLRKSEKVHSIKLIREHIASMKDCEPAAPGSRDADIASVKTREQSVTAAEFERAFPLEPGTTVRKSFAAMAASLDSPDKRPDSAPSRNPGNSVDLTINRLHSRRSLSPSQAHEGSPPVVAPTPSDVSPLERPVSVSAERNIDIRESLLNELLRSNESEDVASFGMRAYHAIRENVLGHQDWGTTGSTCIPENDGEEEEMEGSGAEDAEEEFDLLEELGGGGKMPSEMFYADGHANALDDSSINKTGLDGESTEEFVVVTNSQGEYVFSKLNSPSERSGFGGYVYKDYERSGLGHMDDSNAEGKVFDRKESRDHDRNSSTDRPRNWGSTKSPDEALLAVSQEYSRNTTSDIMVGREDLENTQTLNERTRMISPLKGTHTHFTNEKTPDPLESSNQFRHNYEMESGAGGVSDRRPVDEVGSDPLESSNYGKHNYETRKESGDGVQSDHRSIDEVGSDPLESSNYYKNNYETMKESVGGGMSDHRSVDDGGSDPLESSNYYKHNYETMKESVGGGVSDHRSIDEVGSNPLESSNYYKHNYETRKESGNGVQSDRRSVDEVGSDPLESSDYYKHNYETMRETVGGGVSDHRSIDDGGSDPLESSNYYKHNYETRKESGYGVQSDRRSVDEVGSDRLESSDYYKHNYETRKESGNGVQSDRRSVDEVGSDPLESSNQFRHNYETMRESVGGGVSDHQSIDDGGSDPLESSNYRKHNKETMRESVGGGVSDQRSVDEVGSDPLESSNQFRHNYETMRESVGGGVSDHRSIDDGGSDPLESSNYRKHNKETTRELVGGGVSDQRSVDEVGSDRLESSNQFRHNKETMRESVGGGVSDHRSVDDGGSDPLESSNQFRHNYETMRESVGGGMSDHQSIDEVGSDPLESSNYHKHNEETMRESVGGGVSDQRSVDEVGSNPLESSNQFRHNYETMRESVGGGVSDRRSVDEVGSDPLESSNQFRHNYETMRESVGGGMSDHRSVDDGGSDPLESSNYYKHNYETMKESVGGGVSDHRSIDEVGSNPLESSNYYKHNYETRKESGNGVQSDHRSVDEVGSDPLESSNQFRHNYETMRETVGGGGSDRRALVRGSASGFGGSMPSGDACFHDEIRALLSAEMESISQKKAERDSRRSLRRVELGRDIFFKVQASAKKRMADRNRATFVSEDRKKSIDVSHLSSAKDRVNAPPPPHWAGHGSDSDMRTEVLDHGSSHVARDRVAVGDKRPNGGEIQSVPRMEPTVEGLDAARNGSNLGLPRPPSADDIRYRSGTISGQEIVQKKIPGVSELRGIENEISPPPAGPASSSSTLPRGRGVVTGGSVAMTKPEINTGVSNAPESKHVQAPRELSDREKLIRERSRQRAVELWRKKQDTDSTRSEEHNDASTVATHQTHVTDRSAFGLNSVNEKEHTSNTRKPRKGEVLEIPIGPDDVGVQGKSATPSSIQDQENRRLRFEMMRKKKMEEAADREKIRQQSKERGMSAAGYAARELERRNLAKDPVRGVIKDRGVESSGCGKTRDIRDGDNGPPSVGSSRSRSKLNSRTSARPDGAEATGGTERSGYLTKHIDDTDMDRQIIELEREVANLDVGSVSSGNSGKPRSHSASHSSRRPTSEQLSTRAGRRDSGNHGTPRSVGQKRAMSAGRNRSVTNRRLSNAQQIKNALMNVCLAGSHQSVQREETLDAMDDIVAHIEKAESPSGYVQFVIVMHQSKMLSFKGLYIVDGHTGDITRLCGRGPRIIPTSVIAEYFKYESSTRSFKKLPTLTLANTCDAISVDPTKLKKLASKSEYIM